MKDVKKNMYSLMKFDDVKDEYIAQAENEVFYQCKDDEINIFITAAWFLNGEW